MKNTSVLKLLLIIFLSVATLNGCITPSENLIDRRATEDLGSILEGEKLSTIVSSPSPQNSPWSDLAPDRPLALDEAVSLALMRNRRIRLALRNEGIADDTVAQVFSQYYPSIEINGSFTTRNNDPGLINPDTGRTNISGEREVFSGSVYAKYLLTDFGGRYYRLKGAQLDAAIARIATLDEYRIISLEVADAYFNLLKAQHFYDVVQDSHRLFAEQYKVSKHLYDNELVAKNDVLSAQIGLSRAQQTLVTAENDIELATTLLNYILGLTIDNPTKIIDVTDVPEVHLDYKRLLLLAIDHRPELFRLRKEKQKAEAKLKETKAEFAPSIVANAGIRETSDNFQLNKDYVSAGVFLKWDLIKGGKVPARIRQAHRFVAQVEDRIELQDRQVALEVKSAFLRLDEKQKNIAVAKSAIVQSEENLEIFQDQYKFNLVSITDVLTAQSLLTRSRFDYVATLYDYYRSLAFMEGAVGVRIFSRDREIKKEE